MARRIFAWTGIRENKVVISEIISHPITRYSNKEVFSIFPVKNTFKKVPIIASVNTIKKIVIPEKSNNVMRQTGAYEPNIK